MRLSIVAGLCFLPALGAGCESKKKETPKPSSSAAPSAICPGAHQRLQAAAPRDLIPKYPASEARVPPERNRAEEARIFEAVNRARGVGRRCGEEFYGAAAALVRVPILDEAARVHAFDMARRGYAAHRNLNDETVRERARSVGYEGSVGENIAWRTKSVEQGLHAWLASRGHCRNLMTASYRATGLAVVHGPGFGPVWVQTFGTRLPDTPAGAADAAGHR